METKDGVEKSGTAAEIQADVTEEQSSGAKRKMTRESGR